MRNNVHADPQGPFFRSRNTEIMVRNDEINNAATSPEYIIMFLSSIHESMWPSRKWPCVMIIIKLMVDQNSL